MFSGSGLYVLDKMSHQNISFFPPIIGKVAVYLFSIVILGPILDWNILPLLKPRREVAKQFNPVNK